MSSPVIKSKKAIPKVKCGRCQKWMLENNLPRHQTLHETNQRKKKWFVCKICQKKFNQKANLKKHSIIHDTSTDGYETCEVQGCGKSFTQKCNLKRHVHAVHDQMRLFRCNICDKEFSQKANLKKHETTAIHSEKLNQAAEMVDNDNISTDNPALDTVGPTELIHPVQNKETDQWDESDFPDLPYYFSAIQQKWENPDLIIEGLKSRLAAGRFGCVFSAHSVSRGKEYALKLLRFGNDDFLIECKLQMKANHPNIVKHFGWFRMKSSTRKSPIFVMEYYKDGDLNRMIYSGKRVIKEEMQQSIIRQIVSGALYIHNNLGFIHKDLKPHNIMCASEECFKITDFGCATPFGDPRRPRADHIVQVGNNKGTKRFFTPEEMGGNVFDSTTDVWAIGHISHELITRTKAVDGNGVASVMLAQMRELENQSIKSPTLESLEKSNKMAYDFIRKLLSSRFTRPLLLEVKELPWLKTCHGNS